MGAQPAYLAAGLHGCHHLRPWHTGNTQQLHLVEVDGGQNGAGRILLQVAIDNSVFLPAFQHRRQRQHRKRKPAIPRFGGPRMEKNDHFTTLAE
jgi:hypothetical protein